MDRTRLAVKSVKEKVVLNKYMAQSNILLDYLAQNARATASDVATVTVSPSLASATQSKIVRTVAMSPLNSARESFERDRVTR